MNGGREKGVKSSHLHMLGLRHPLDIQVDMLSKTWIYESRVPGRVRAWDIHLGVFSIQMYLKPQDEVT